MRYCKIEVRGQKFEIHDLGMTMNLVLVELYEQFLSQPSPVNCFDVELEQYYVYFWSHSKKPKALQRFFENLTPLWQWLISNGRFKDAEHVWEWAVGCARSFEGYYPERPIHKGTPLYFWGMTALRDGNIDKGFLLMHQALEEDVRTFQTQNPNTPARAFVVLDYTKSDQAFRPMLQDMASFLGEFLRHYCESRTGNLTLDEFRGRFLQSVELGDAVFAFVFSLCKIDALVRRGMLTRLPPYIFLLNEFAGLLEVGLIFDVCLVIDAVIRHKNRSSWRFLQHAAFLSSACGLDLSEARLGELNRAFGEGFQDFPAVAKRLVEGVFAFADGKQLAGIEADIALAYGFRNLGAHRLIGLAFVYDNFEVLIQRIMNVLFLAIERLY